CRYMRRDASDVHAFGHDWLRSGVNREIYPPSRIASLKEAIPRLDTPRAAVDRLSSALGL
ncbi:MAG TPA: hypothetical protein VE197_02505, partial [Mycobacterium sp.]|nr:hypothetical protein [Mycobacterium sp.]